MTRPAKFDRRLTGDTQQIEALASRMRDIGQAILDACSTGEPVEGYAWDKLAGGSLAGDVAALGIILVQNVLEEQEA